MKFQLEPQVHNAGMQLEAIPDRILDGHPKIDRLAFDTVLEKVSPDHIAVSAVIAFGDFIGHDIEIPNPVSRQAAEGIQDYLDSRKVSVRSLTDAPRKQWPSKGALEVNYFPNAIDTSTTSVVEASKHQLCLADGATFNGAIGSPEQSIVASNYRVFSRANRVNAAKVLVAHGVLFSRDLHIRMLQVPLDNLSKHESKRIVELIRAVDLNIRFV